MRTRSLVLLFGTLLLSAEAVAASPTVFVPIEIVTAVPRPIALVFISREDLAKDYVLEVRETFVPKISQVLERGPF